MAVVESAELVHEAQTPEALLDLEAQAAHGASRSLELPRDVGVGVARETKLDNRSLQLQISSDTGPRLSTNFSACTSIF